MFAPEVDNMLCYLCRVYLTHSLPPPWNISPIIPILQMPINSKSHSVELQINRILL